MLELALKGTKKYWGWIFLLSAIILVGVYFYSRQFDYGLGITGLSRDVTWGFYIAQLTFLVGVAASGVMVVLPYYLHNYKAFGKLTILGEFLAIASIVMCILFVAVDVGQPLRMINLILYPSPSSILFWDTVVLSGYLLLNVIISHTVLEAERKSIAPPNWIKPIIILSIPWAISIHTVTAFLYSGLAARPFWMTAVLAPRFLASAFSSGPALLLIMVFIIKRITKFDPGHEPVRKLGLIITYAMCANVFFILMEFFTAFYSSIPEHIHHFQYLYFGLDGHNTLVPWMWSSAILAIVSLVFLLIPKYRENEKVLVWICAAIFISIWIDKGLGMVVT
ncbi:MAG: NrfD/PsrC family molybdoenzyme membrane anchor subunit, partial [Ignavibacteriaceae bacterium]